MAAARRQRGHSAVFPPSVSTYVMTRSCRCRAAYVYWCCGALLVVTIVPCDRVIAYLYIPHLKWVLCIWYCSAGCNFAAKVYYPGRVGRPGPQAC